MQRESQRNEVPFLGLLGSLTSEVLELGRELGFPSLGLVLVVWPLTTLHLCPALGHSSLSRASVRVGAGWPGIPHITGRSPGFVERTERPIPVFEMPSGPLLPSTQEALPSTKLVISTTGP